MSVSVFDLNDHVSSFAARQSVGRRVFVKAGVAVSFGVTLVHARNAEAVNAAVINRSARMRALSQRLVKLKTQQFLQVSPDATSDSIVVTEKLMASHLQFLSSSVPVSSRSKFDTVSRQTAALLAQAKAVPTVESLLKTNEMSQDLLKAADELTVEMQALAKVKAIEVVNVAGRQRMLSQRMAKNFFLAAARADNKEAATKISADRKLFSDSMKLLGDSPVADVKIKQEHANLANRYRKFDELVADLSEKGLAKANLVSMAALSEQVLASAHELTVLFEESLRTKEVGA
jgi:Type IV pili methyl-accepting chemotaxis transducer N-term